MPFFRLLAIFEAGIITKMTENEYEKLGKQKVMSDVEIHENDVPTTKTETKRAAKVNEDNEKLKPIRLKMVQGTFYILFIGNVFSALILLAEIGFHRYHKKSKRRRKNRFLSLKKLWRRTKHYIRTTTNKLGTMYRRFMHDAFTQTLEYVE